MASLVAPKCRAACPCRHPHRVFPSAEMGCGRNRGHAGYAWKSVPSTTCGGGSPRAWALRQDRRDRGGRAGASGLDPATQKLTVVERDFAGRTHLRKIMPSASVCLRRCDNRRSRDGPAALSLPSRLLSIGMVES
jgi:hypothetical protein